MTHVSRFTFDADGADITPYVDLWRWRHGNAVFNNDRRDTFFNPSGTMTLENGNGYWTDDRLEGLSTITVQNDGVTIGVCKVAKWDLFPDRHIASLRLASSIVDTYEDPVMFIAAGDIDEADVLARAGLTITNRSPWVGYTTRQSASYCSGRYEFLKAFGVYADAYLAEDHMGGFIAVLPHTETRSPSVDIHDNTHWIASARRRYVRQRGWRRNLQEVKLRMRTLFDQGIRDFGGTGWGHTNQDLGGYRLIHAYRHNSSTIRVEFDMEGVVESNDYPSDFHSLVCEAVFWSSGSPGTPRFRDASRQNASEYEWDGQLSQAPGTSERCAVYLTKANGGSVSTGDANNLQIFGLSRIRVYITRDNEFSERSVTYSVGTAPFTPMPDMPWAIADADVSNILVKLNRASSFVPEATRVMFSTDQDTQARWNEILNLEIGDTVNLSLLADGMDAHSQSWAMSKSWDFRARGHSLVEVQFLSHGENLRSRVALADPDHPVFLGDEDHPVEIGVRQ